MPEPVAFPPGLVAPPGDGEPDWLAMVLDHALRTGVPKWRYGLDLGRAHLECFSGGEIIACKGFDDYAHETMVEVYGPNTEPGGQRQVKLTVSGRPFTATEMWTLCVLVGLLPDRSRDA